jgi:ATP-dependent DNA helicase RecG
MTENQNIEYKESWRDEYLKGICGFANADGGSIFIGMKDDGSVIGLKDFKKLLEDIPNKARNIMGVTVSIWLLEKHDKKYLKIITPPYHVPVSLRGRYYQRSGSTNQELTGNTLNEFLIQRFGKA